MPHYQFKAVTADGKPTQGNLFAMSTADAVEMLSKRGWVPTQLEPPKPWLPELRYVALSQQVAWYSMLADLLGSGMPLADSLDLLVDRTTNPQLAEALATFAVESFRVSPSANRCAITLKCSIHWRSASLQPAKKVHSSIKCLRK